jgi:hypothetical protein
VKNLNSVVVDEAVNNQLKNRLAPFLASGMLTGVPNQWQITQGNWEMAPYVVVPDVDDSDRYAGAVMGHPMLRTPLVLAYIGWDHFKVGSGLSASVDAIIKHLCIVHHQVMPDYDLQLLQTHPNGFEKLEAYIKQLDSEKPRFKHRMHKKVIDAVLPDAREYRSMYLGENGWIARAKRMDYTQDSMIPDYLRADFFSLVKFLEYCLTLPATCGMFKKPSELVKRMKTRFAEP